MFRRIWETARKNRRPQNKYAKSRKRKPTEPIYGCDYGDLGLFPALLLFGSATAAVVGRAPALDRASRAPALDRAGRAAIRGYRRWLSPHWPGQCRFTLTCGAYGLTAVERYGMAVGGRMAAERVRRCRPGVPRGTVDPVR